MTAAMTLEDARLQTLRFLDDEDGQRWTLNTGAWSGSNEVDLALQMAANECIAVYCSMGGDFFDTVLDVGTTNGVFSFDDMTMPPPLPGPPIPAVPRIPMMIQSVTMKEGTSYYSIAAIREQDIEQDSIVNQSLKVRVVFQPDFSDLAAASSLRYSRDVNSAQLGWPVFDQWVCAVAAKHLTPKENETNAQLDQRIAMLRESCVKAPEAPLSVRFPRQDQRIRSPNSMMYRWSYVSRDLAADKLACIRIHKVSFR